MPKLSDKNDKDSLSLTKFLNFQTSKFESGEYSDLTIKCKDRKWRVHRLVVCCHSAFLDRACKEDTFKEGIVREIILHEDDPDLVGEMLLWCYNQGIHNSAEDSDLLVIANMYALADKYGIPDLKQDTLSKFKAILATSPQIILDEYPQVIVDVIETVYTTTPNTDRGLRNAIFSLIPGMYRPLESKKEYIELFRSGLADGDFALDVLACLRDSTRDLCFYCDRCERAISDQPDCLREKLECDHCGTIFGNHLRSRDYPGPS